MLELNIYDSFDRDAVVVPGQYDQLDQEYGLFVNPSAAM